MLSLQQSEYKYFSSTRNKHQIASLFASPLGQYRMMLPLVSSQQAKKTNKHIL
jgi:hypothetical protein